MKLFVIFVLIFGLEAQGQTVADKARAERERRKGLHTAVKVEKQGEVQAEKPAAPVKAVKALPEKETDAKEPSIEQRLQNERVNLIKERSALLVKLDQVQNDPEARKAIEAELIALTQRAESLKLQHLENNPQ